MNIDFFVALIYIVPAALIAIVMHEFSHGFVSHLLGDPTPASEGRLSLNPLKHLDLIGTACLIFFRFGWAKPVKVNPMYYKNRKMGMVLVALAGVTMNFIIAFFSVLVMGIIIKTNSTYETGFIFYVFTFFNFLAIINIGLGIFNLFPIPPLDGSKVFLSFLPEEHYFKVLEYERYGVLILLIVLSTGLLTNSLVFLQQWVIDLFFNVIKFTLNIT